MRHPIKFNSPLGEIGGTISYCAVGEHVRVSVILDSLPFIARSFLGADWTEEKGTMIPKADAHAHLVSLAKALGVQLPDA